MENKMKNQIRLIATTHSNQEANSGFIFTDSEKVSNAEILQVIHVVDTNQSFWSCKYDNDRFAKNVFSFIDSCMVLAIWN